MGQLVSMVMQGMVHDRVGRMGLGRYTWMGAPTMYARINIFNQIKSLSAEIEGITSLH